MTTTTLDPRNRTDDERLVFVEDHDGVKPDARLDDHDNAGQLRERYDEQILAALVTF